MCIIKEKHDATFSCLDTAECKDKRQKWIEKAEKFVQYGEQELEIFVGKLAKGQAMVLLEDKHFKKRYIERAVSNKEVLDTIMSGWCIERSKTKGSAVLCILGYTEKNRPLHVIVTQITETKWCVVTAYDPRSHSWKWSENFDQKICFCSHEE